MLSQFRREEIRRYRLLEVAGPDRDLPDHSERAVASLAARSARPRLAAALAGLSSGDRDALLLVVWAELSYEEAARALAVPVGTVASRMHRARAKLREALADIDYKGILANE
jgi:RNA polymerase sigma-70 factor (ECF subfamily)